MKQSLFILSFLVSSNIIGQGCSDAGFCSLISTTPLSHNFGSKKAANPSTFRVSQSIGQGDYKIMAYNTSLEYSRVVSSTFTFNTRINFLAHSGADAEVGEIGDVFLTGDFKIAPKLTAITGLKIPLRNGDKSKKGVTLPMDYQSTLGSFDFLFGLATQIENFGLSIGWQQPLNQNTNQFISRNFIGTETFQTTNQYFRNPDVWVRLAYPIRLKKLTLVPNVLPIYHLGNDTYFENNQRNTIYGSKGLTFNFDIQADYKLSESSTIGLNLAAPIITRTARPDGLTRKYVITADYRISF